MEDMMPFKYEFLIRRVHQCDKCDIPGADAEKYWKMECAYLGYKKCACGQGNPEAGNLAEAAGVYAYWLGTIAAYVLTAITEVLKNHRDKLCAGQLDELEECRSLLQYPNHDHIEQCVNRTEKILRELDIYPQ